MLLQYSHVPPYEHINDIFISTTILHGMTFLFSAKKALYLTMISGKIEGKNTFDTPFSEPPLKLN